MSIQVLTEYFKQFEIQKITNKIFYFEIILKEYNEFVRDKNNRNRLYLLEKELKTKLVIKPTNPLDSKIILTLLESVKEDKDVIDVLLDPELYLLTVFTKNLFNPLSFKKRIRGLTKNFFIIKYHYARTEDNQKLACAKTILNKKNRRQILSTFIKRLGSLNLEEANLKVTFLGGVREVGRTCYLLTIEDFKILIDCGVSFDSEREHPLINRLEIPTLDLIIVSHSHSDHVGFVPFLFRAGYQGPLLMTTATRDLSSLICLDYLKVSKNPPYRLQDIISMVEHSFEVFIGQEIFLNETISLEFLAAGHILGSFSLLIKTPGKKILFTNDIKLKNVQALTPFELPSGLTSVIAEGTYLGSPTKTPYRGIVKAIRTSLHNKGTVMVPVFAVGRSFEVLLWLINNFSISDISLKGTLLRNSLELHLTYLEVYREPFKRYLRSVFKNIQEIMRRPESSSEKIVITTSGMCSGGPIIEEIRTNFFNQNSLLLVTGYQARGTLGDLILRKIYPQVSMAIMNVVTEFKFKPINMGIFSGHLSKEDFLFLFKKYTGKLILVHSEYDKPSIDEVNFILPEIGETFILE